MPDFRAIKIRVNTQFDVCDVAEYEPPKGEGFPKIQENNVASVYIQARPGAQFWICYAIEELKPSAAYFYFKLSINGIHVTSWGIGKEEGFKGKTMHALYEAKETWNIRNSVAERRGFFFAGDNVDDGKQLTDYQPRFEISVYRAIGRQRIVKEMNQYRDTAHGHIRPEGLELVSVGPARKDHPKKFYKYALEDPVDKPYATFRYYCKTLDELKRLGIVKFNNGSEESDISIQWHDLSESTQDLNSMDGSSRENSLTALYLSMPSKTASNEDDEKDIEEDKFGFVGRQKRLSIPPSRRLFPTSRSSYPMPLFSSADNWRAPSPIRGGFRDVESPTPGRRRSHGLDVMQGTVDNASSGKGKSGGRWS